MAQGPSRCIFFLRCGKSQHIAIGHSQHNQSVLIHPEFSNTLFNYAVNLANGSYLKQDFHVHYQKLEHNLSKRYVIVTSYNSINIKIICSYHFAWADQKAKQGYIVN